MTAPLIRSVVSELEVVADGRSVLGLICPYERVATVDDGWGEFRETFDKGAFARVMRARPQHVRLHLEHEGAWVGRGEKWLDGNDGLHMAFRLDDTEPGRVAAYKIRDGQTPGFSIGFVPGRTITKMHADGPVEHRQTIRSLHHVAVVPAPAYAEAQVSAIRTAPSVDRVSLWQAWLDSQHP